MKLLTKPQTSAQDVFVIREVFYNQNFYKKCGGMTSRLRLGCGGCKPEKAKPKMWGVSVPPESQPMKPEAGRPSATNVAIVTKVAGGSER